jgi:hypothetical protein
LVIQNPPYGKLTLSSPHRQAMSHRAGRAESLRSVSRPGRNRFAAPWAAGRYHPAVVLQRSVLR